MIRSAAAVAHPNIALTKYWGKLDGMSRMPSVPSLSMTLDGMSTTTSVTFDDALERDHVVLNGNVASDKEARRASEVLDRVRAAAGIAGKARVESANDFPTASGLASSASGFAALVVAAAKAAGLDWDAARLSDQARRSSVSAARSIFGGFATLAAGVPGRDLLSAEPIEGSIDWQVAISVVVTTLRQKDVGSTEGMAHTSNTSPYYPAWVASAPRLFERARRAVIARDLEALGVVAEESAFAMHASAMAAAPALIYFNPVTLAAIERVRRLRQEGTQAYVTIDAGPHVEVLSHAADAAKVTAAMREVTGVEKVLITRPGRTRLGEDRRPIMMARAPGKIVLSGAYAVLEGAPALVAAVDRYVVADPRREAEFVTPEVREALQNRGATRAPWFDARALRDETTDRKLGLGSSAAILVASLAALELGSEPSLDDAALARRVFDAALCAHRIAQGGGSGIDVAASAFGGILRFQLPGEGSVLPITARVELPQPLVIRVWSSASAASTAMMLEGVAELKKTHPSEHRAALDELAGAAEAAVQAASGAAYVAACRRQLAGLISLGRLAHVPIVTPEVAELDRAAQTVGAAILPSGAGGGDVVLMISEDPPHADLESSARRLGLVPLNLALGVRGVHALAEPLALEGRDRTSP